MQTAHKAWGGAASGVLVALIALLGQYFSAGEVQPMALSAFGDALGMLMELAVSAVVGYLGVYFAPRNKEISA